MSKYDQATETARKLLVSLETLNKEKADALKLLREQTQTPSLESLEKVLKHLREEMMNKSSDAQAMGIEIKMIITMSHKLASVLDEPFGEIKKIFDKYDIPAPKFEET